MTSKSDRHSFSNSLCSMALSTKLSLNLVIIISCWHGQL